MTSRLVAIALAASAASCGDGGPSGSSATSTTTTTAPASIVFTVVSGETGAPISGATVIVGGTTLTTDGNGTVDAGALRVGVNIDVVSADHFDRQTLYRGGDSRYSLWPMTSPTGLTPEITQRLVYSGYGEDAILGELPLVRPPLGETIQVFVDPSASGDARVGRVVEEAVTALRSALQGASTVEVTTSPPAGGVVWRITVNPDATSSEFIAITRLSFDGDEIVGAELAFRTQPDLYEDGRLLTNMMGTAFGFGDSHDPNDRMYFDWWRRRTNDYSPKEGLLMRLMLQRRAGNRWPDNDRSLGTSNLRVLPIGRIKSTRP